MKIPFLDNSPPDAVACVSGDFARCPTTRRPADVIPDDDVVSSAPEDGVERIRRIFSQIPQVPGQVDFLYDPAAMIDRRPILVLRQHGHLMATHIIRWPETGPLSEILEEAVIFSLPVSRLGAVEVRAVDAIGNWRGMTAQAVELWYPRAEILLDVVTDIDVAEHTRRGSIAQLLTRDLPNLVLLAPVPGIHSQSVTTYMKMRALPVKPAWVSQRPDTAGELLARYAGTRYGIMGYRQLQKMPEAGFREPYRADSTAGFWAWLLGVLGIRRRELKIILPPRRSGSSPMLRNMREEIMSGRRPSQTMIPKPSPGTDERVMSDRERMLTERLGIPVTIVQKPTEIEGLPPAAKVGTYAIVQCGDGTREMRIATEADARNLVLKGERLLSRGEINPKTEGTIILLADTYLGKP